MRARYVAHPASTEPRPDGRGMAPATLPVPGSIPLQRSRALTGAEWIVLHVTAYGDGTAASTEPRPDGRGMDYISPELIEITVPLQRSRALTGAECSFSSSAVHAVA